MSSFVVEMTELRNIIQRADKHSLIIGDEICSGTEAISGVCIVSSAINELLNKKASFIFTSHLHELSSISLIKDREELKIYHMHIEIRDDNTIIYDRKLKEGQGSNVYGIEVCKSLDMPNDFMKNAEKSDLCSTKWKILWTSSMRPYRWPVNQSSLNFKKSWPRRTTLRIIQT